MFFQFQISVKSNHLFTALSTHTVHLTSGTERSARRTANKQVYPAEFGCIQFPNVTYMDNVREVATCLHNSIFVYLGSIINLRLYAKLPQSNHAAAHTIKQRQYPHSEIFKLGKTPAASNKILETASLYSLSLISSPK